MAAKRTQKSQKSKTAEVALVDESPDSVARRTFVVLTVTTGFIMLLGFIYLVRQVLLWMVIALFISMALAPFVRWLMRRNFPRVLASLTAVLATVVVVFGLLGAAVTPLVSQTTSLLDNLPSYVENLTKNETLKKADERFDLIDRTKAFSNKAPEVILGGGSSVLNTARSAFSAVATVFIIVTMSFFMLLEGPTVWAQLVTFFRRDHGIRIKTTGEEIAKAVSGYVTGNLFISLIAGTVALITLLALKVPYAVPLAIFVAIFDLIPLVGAALATVLLFLVALTVSVPAAIAVVVVMIVYQQIEGNVIQPVVYGRTVQLSTLYVFVASIIGASLGGIIGVLLAIPVAATVKIIFVETMKDTMPGRRAHLND